MKEMPEELCEHPFLRGLASQHIKTLSDLAMRVEFKPGELIFKAGDLANRFYLLQTGQIALESPEADTALQILGPGDVLGWSWLFEPYQWQFDARALEPTSAVFLYGTRLREVCESHPDFGYALLKRCTRIVIERLHATAQKLSASPAQLLKAETL